MHLTLVSACCVPFRSLSVFNWPLSVTLMSFFYVVLTMHSSSSSSCCSSSSSLVLQAAKSAGDQAQAANGGRVPPYPGLQHRVTSSIKLSDLGSSHQDLPSLQQTPGWWQAHILFLWCTTLLGCCVGEDTRLKSSHHSAPTT